MRRSTARTEDLVTRAERALLARAHRNFRVYEVVAEFDRAGVLPADPLRQACIKRELAQRRWTFATEAEMEKAEAEYASAAMEFERLEARAAGRPAAQGVLLTPCQLTEAEWLAMASPGGCATRGIAHEEEPIVDIES
jgi:hypothetical protein